MKGFPILTERKNMEKKPKNTAGDRNENPAPQGSKWLDEAIIRYIIRALLLLIVFAWALVNLDAVLRFLGKVLALFTPFLIGGAIAFLINVVLRPLECCWNKVCRKTPAKLVRPVCLTASTVLVLGILFAVVFMMIPACGNPAKSLSKTFRSMWRKSGGGGQALSGLPQNITLSCPNTP